MFRALFGVIFGIFFIVITGSIILEAFPQLQPLWEEFKNIVVSLYESSTVKYGTVVTVLIIIGLVILFGTSRGAKR
ncbi:hypothetical protein LI012_12800 [Caldibacillus thermoamylovorans]|uniref:hypothetical protein n=1 Tax=Caldibacillus thermoamylovorans TaxID=35841 RepID=UPI001D06D527|nr:hypothetical protein [Caldibacillus thermoamylovorans]MCB5935655.1 hypothetical protein [Bacillus sp. DFI.2.34]MCB7077691.1 hypothetical protein [Caldibacillus thermoamylovorans]